MANYAKNSGPFRRFPVKIFIYHSFPQYLRLFTHKAAVPLPSGRRDGLEESFPIYTENSRSLYTGKGQ